MMAERSLCRPELRLSIVENKAETLSIAIRRRGEIFLKLSRASNNRCRFCNDAAFQDGTFWPFEALTAMIDEGLARGVKRVFLSGGEPTIHPRFLAIIAYARRHGAEQVICITNGRLFAYPEFADKAVHLGLREAFVALLGADAATHDDLTQVPGSFAQTTSGIRNLLERGVRVHLSTVVNRRNLTQLPDMLALVRGVTGLTAVRIAPAGRALWESLDDLGFELEEARAPIAAAFRTADALGIEFRPKLFPASVYEGRERDYTHHEEYLPEIKDTELRTGLFGRFARAEGDIACRGETCRVCFRRPFCDAFYELRTRLAAGSHTVVRADLDDAEQCARLAAFAGTRRLWLRVARASDVAPRLAALGITTEPWLVCAGALGDGPAPACHALVLPADAEISDPARLASARYVGIAPVSERLVPDALRARATFLFVAAHERFRDEQARGLTRPEPAIATGLPIAGLPPCLARAPLPFAWPDEREVLDLGVLAKTDAAPGTDPEPQAGTHAQALDVVGFTHHFLRDLDRDKSTRCGACARVAACPGLHVNHARRWGFSVLEPLRHEDALGSSAAPLSEIARAAEVAAEPARPAAAANFAALGSRFRALAAQETWRRSASPPELAAGLVHALADVDPALLCIDRPSRDELAARARRAADAAFAQGGAALVEALGAGARAAAARIARGSLWHGTGSWALDGVLARGALIPGGDGLTGEVALTHLRSRDIYLCVGGEPASAYAATSFAFMNCGTSGHALELSAVRAGAVPVGELFSELAFGADEPRFSAATRRMHDALLRYRTLAMEQTLARAADRALELARAGRLAGDGRDYTRRLAAAGAEEVAFANVLSAVVERMQADAEVMRTPARVRLAAGVLRYVPELRAELWCPLPEDDGARRAHKLSVLAALGRQFPCVLELAPEGIEARPDPSYAYSPERLVGHAIPVSAIRALHVPRAQMRALELRLISHGLTPEVAPLEDFEALRFVAEAVAP